MRDVPQYISQLGIGSMPKIQISSASAQLAGAASDAMNRFAVTMQQKSSELEELRARTTLRENLHRMANEAGSNVGALKANIDGYKKGFIKTIKDPELAAKFDVTYGVEALPYIDAATNKYSRVLDTDLEKTAITHANTSIGSIGQIAPNLRSNIPEQREAAQKALQGIFDDVAKSASIMKTDGTPMFSAQQQVAMAAAAQKEYVLSLPPQERLQAIGVSDGGFQEAMISVFQNEGGYSPSDGGTGVPVKFGINQKSHPDVDVQNLTQEQAAEIYKKDYWDAYGLEKLRPDQQAIVMDGVVNHHEDFKRKLVEAAKNGASPAELIAMRQKEYDRLGKTGEYPENVQKSWDNRLAKFEHYALKENLSFLGPEALDSIRNETIAAMQKDAALFQKDPVQWGESHSMIMPQIIDAQLSSGIPKQYVNVLSSNKAGMLAEKLNQLQTGDDIVSFAQQLQAEFKEYTPNAMQDLKKYGKMKPEMEGALQLASTGNPLFSEQVKLLADIGAVGAEVFKKDFTSAGFSTANLNAKIAEQTDDIRLALEAEGHGASIPEKMGVLSNLAMRRMLSTGDKDYSRAADFAMQPFDTMYKVARKNGGNYRIPSQYDDGLVEDGLDEYMSDKLPKIVGEDNTYVYNGKVYPFMNQKEDGLRFRAANGEVVFGKDGKMVEVKFEDLIRGRKPVKKIDPSYELHGVY